MRENSEKCLNPPSLKCTKAKDEGILGKVFKPPPLKCTKAKDEGVLGKVFKPPSPSYVSLFVVVV